MAESNKRKRNAKVMHPYTVHTLSHSFWIDKIGGCLAAFSFRDQGFGI